MTYNSLSNKLMNQSFDIASSESYFDNHYGISGRRGHRLASKMLVKKGYNFVILEDFSNFLLSFSLPCKWFMKLKPFYLSVLILSARVSWC